jgi:hypothetical protein
MPYCQKSVKQSKKIIGWCDRFNASQDDTIDAEKYIDAQL